MKNTAFYGLAFVFAVAISALTMATLAAETVQFSAADIQPTPFKVKRAAAKGITLEPTPGMAFAAEFTKPEGSGPFPAIVLLVSGGGQLASHVAWANLLTDWGYATLLVDSFGARGGTSKQDSAAVDMSVDAFAAYDYLSQHSDVDPAKIGILGWSMGASFVFPALRETNKRRPETVDFKAAVTFYPTCEFDHQYTKPILVFFGEQDQLVSLSSCQKMAAENTIADAINLQVYAEAGHFFDSTDYAKDTGLHAAGWSEPFAYQSHDYNAQAHADSIEITRVFLDSTLK